jgi:hypothetical protein
MQGFARFLRSCALVAVAAMISGCGTGVAGAAGAESARPSLPAFPATLNPDGTVPWVNAPAIDPDVPPPPPPAAGPTCTAGQSQGVLPAWVSGQASNDGGMDPLTAASLHGWVNLTNISSRPCTLDGVPAVTLMSHGIPVNVSYGQFGTNAAAKVGLPPHGTANFRIDWGAPYCPGKRGPFPGPPDRGPFSLRVTVDGLTLHVAIKSTATPGCLSEDTDPNATTSSVATSPIKPGAVIPGQPAGKPSPLQALRATPKDYPSQIAPGQLLRFVIALANPTSAPVSLAGTPPPGYLVEAFCLGNPSGPGLNFYRTYSLNNRPRPVVPAHGRVRFAMELPIPASGCPTTRLTISWRFPLFGPQGTYTTFTLTITADTVTGRWRSISPPGTRLAV